MKKFTVVCLNPKGKRLYYDAKKDRWDHQLTEACLFGFAECAALLQARHSNLLPAGHTNINVLYIRLKPQRTKQDYLKKMLEFRGVNADVQE